MNDPDARLGWTVMKAIPRDNSEASYNAMLAVHSLVWSLWQIREALRISQGEGQNA